MTQGKSQKYSEKNLSLRPCVHHKFLIIWPGNEPGPPLVKEKVYELMHVRCSVITMVMCLCL